MKRLALAPLLLLAALPSLASDTRTVDAVYTATLTGVPEAKVLKVWIPIPQSNSRQEISDVEIDSPHEFAIKSEPAFGNKYAFARIENAPKGDFVVRVKFRATRRTVLFEKLPVTKASPDELSLNLKPNRLVTLSPRVRGLASDVTNGKETPIAKARAIYDYLLANMKYDKTTPGWGQGDTERACDIKTGNCTDFHSLFMSLARVEGIPSRFIIGFPMAKGGNQTKGYHCWAEFYVEGIGWVPVDASDASKSSDQKIREFLFGNLDPDRVEFTMGRDIALDPPTKQPLNYF
ncbi:MAG TPA: transglutaminase-like domain-containing protein, partial [Thermoanaerobaculia bacterium]